MPPSGNTTEAAQAYYNWLYQQYYSGIPADRTQILWSGPFWVALFATILILFFYFYAYHFQQVHREEGELYGAVSFAGSILERIGSVATFSRVVWSVIVVWGFYYIISQILYGQVY